MFICQMSTEHKLKHAAIAKHVILNSCLAFKPKANKTSLTLSLQQSTCQTTCPPNAAMALLFQTTFLGELSRLWGVYWYKFMVYRSTTCETKLLLYHMWGCQTKVTITGVIQIQRSILFLKLIEYYTFKITGSMLNRSWVDVKCG